MTSAKGMIDLNGINSRTTCKDFFDLQYPAPLDWDPGSKMIFFPFFFQVAHYFEERQMFNNMQANLLSIYFIYWQQSKLIREFQF